MKLEIVRLTIMSKGPASWFIAACLCASLGLSLGAEEVGRLLGGTQDVADDARLSPVSGLRVTIIVYKVKVLEVMKGHRGKCSFYGSMRVGVGGAWGGCSTSTFSKGAKVEGDLTRFQEGRHSGHGLHQTR